MTLSPRPISYLFCFLLLLIIPQGCQPVKALGENPTGEDLDKIEALPNYRNGEFQNLESNYSGSPSNTTRRSPRWLRMFKYLFSKPKITRPSKSLPVAITDLKNMSVAKPTIIWFGHSSFLIKTSNATILLDPNFSGYAGPFRGLIDAFPGSNAYDARDMPEIDALVISHDHYDHLDYETVKNLKKKVKKVIVPIGVGSHFRKWGYDSATVTELNWNEAFVINDKVSVTATPAHHRSNRTFEQRKTLWASYVINADGYNIYFSGDTGYSKHFKIIGEQYGPFDLALMECGQYNSRWSHNHMFPYQTARAARDINASMVIPMHWGKFAESDHPWSEPVKLFLASADSLKLNVSVPFIGQPFTINEPIPFIKWWENYEHK